MGTGVLGTHAATCPQTVLGLAVQVGTPEYQRREVVVAPDGVELLLDFKEAPHTPVDAPLMVILHGIGARLRAALRRKGSCNVVVHVA